MTEFLIFIPRACLKWLAVALFIWPTVAGATPLRVAYGNSLPPWVFADTDSGILLDITRASVEPAGYQVVPVYYPYARRVTAYIKHQVDVVTDITPSMVAKEGLEGYLSLLFYRYENFAISLSERNYQFDKIMDLTTLNVLSWQGAANTLGGEYVEMVRANPNYAETYNQENQIKMLYLKRVDVIQMDLQIFKYYQGLVSQKAIINTQQSVDMFPLFGQNHCGFLFRSKAARDAFNQHFEALKDSPLHAQIYSKYTPDLQSKKSTADIQ